MEDWRDIPEYSGLYQISSYGNVRSCTRTKWNGKKDILAKGRLLQPWEANGGYKCVYLCRNGSKRLYKIHRLVAIVFIPNTESKPEVNHKDGNRGNNHVSNLEWCTKSENNQHSYTVLNRISPMRGKTGVKCVLSKRIAQYDLSGGFIKVWDSMMDAQRELGISASNISACCRGKFASMGGYKWKFYNEK